MLASATPSNTRTTQHLAWQRSNVESMEFGRTLRAQKGCRLTICEPPLPPWTVKSPLPDLLFDCESPLVAPLLDDDDDPASPEEDGSFLALRWIIAETVGGFLSLTNLDEGL